MIFNTTWYYYLSGKPMMIVMLHEMCSFYLHLLNNQVMNNAIKIATDLLAVAIILTGGLLVKPILNWLLTQLYKIFISSGYLK